MRSWCLSHPTATWLITMLPLAFFSWSTTQSFDEGHWGWALLNLGCVFISVGRARRWWKRT